MARAARRVLDELRARPWYVALGAVVVGLIAGSRAPVAVLVAAFVVPVLGSRASVRLALVAALLAAALVGQSRLHAIDATRLAPRIGHAVSSRVTLLETTKADRLSRLEIAGAAGLLTLHPEPDDSALHGNLVDWHNRGHVGTHVGGQLPRQRLLQRKQLHGGLFDGKH